MMKLFVLNRTEDETGVSGTGIVAEGVRFTNGKCALSWLSEHTSVALYDDIATLEAIHGYDGKTVVEWCYIPNIKPAPEPMDGSGMSDLKRNLLEIGAALEQKIDQIEDSTDVPEPGDYRAGLEELFVAAHKTTKETRDEA